MTAIFIHKCINRLILSALVMMYIISLIENRTYRSYKNTIVTMNSLSSDFDILVLYAVIT